MRRRHIKRKMREFPDSPIFRAGCTAQPKIIIIKRKMNGQQR